MKSLLKIFWCWLMLWASGYINAQHRVQAKVVLDHQKHQLLIEQQLTYFNSSNDTLKKLILNDWNNAYSSKSSLLAKRFSDEFVRSFHFARAKELGATSVEKIASSHGQNLNWERLPEQVDLIEVDLAQPILPQQKQTIVLVYVLQIPSDRFTDFGYTEKGGYALRDWLLLPALYRDQKFARYSNADLDDAAYGLTDFDLEVHVPEHLELFTDLSQTSVEKSNAEKVYTIAGTSRVNFSFYLQPKPEFYSYKNNDIEVVTDIQDAKLNDIQKAVIIDQIADFVQDHLGRYPLSKMTLSQVDYSRNPFYGLNQLPSFISVFKDDFMFELKFLKTYLNSYLQNSLHLDPRKEHWVYDGIQSYLMMQYVAQYHPDMKMMGGLYKYRWLRGFNLVSTEFNEQYNYFYLLMARRNLDQAPGESREQLIRFNEKIATKYYAGLSLKYLDSYLEENKLSQALRDFVAANAHKNTSRTDFEQALKSQTDKSIDWFFNHCIDSRKPIDFSFENITKTQDSVTLTIRNKTGVQLPVPLFGLHQKQVIFKQWIEQFARDTTLTIARTTFDKLALNHLNEVPEFNRRNNYRTLRGGIHPNKPFRFTLLKDLENPEYNQIIYVPSIGYNLYDGITPGLRLHNKTILNRPFSYDINPMYSFKTTALKGHMSLAYNQFNRESQWYNIRYALNSSLFNYAPDASYFKINPNLTFNIRDRDFRSNHRQAFVLKYSAVEKQQTNYLVETNIQNYSVFGFKYIDAHNEVAHKFNLITDTQFSNSFGKVSGEIQYRKLFSNSHQFDIRVFAGAFTYNRNTNSNAFDFGLTRINDYLFEQELLGRSEKSGVFSQQFIMGEGGFKSKVSPETVNQWLITSNLSFNVWNWIELYGDAGLVKNRLAPAKFVYDSGIRLNLVPDYFEFYLPVYSNNGWEISQSQYPEKVRIVFTIDPKVLVNLFTRKWF
ncbi:aminopeptidase [Flavobacterium sp. CYK-55]|uniref:aminopeptidase n=1 Tax=Flavobacterium sp. CYK-55 TaxID=2835529 RepID=UPI001BCEE9CC|nr:aminopeptidase [Flavobacterium sp. CYK-55]MBS7788132.1 aminopeptidase [Flavobacterium sp. CYK-55]